jgi:asparagine synthase (glutamine-hydrolysing)
MTSKGSIVRNDQYETIAYLPLEKATNNENLNCHIGLGHRRLSIVELSLLGHQPMCTPDERFWIIFNGEIYNYIEIRAELESLGEVFYTHSDTEVILVAYRRWGSNCLSKFNGMWALAIYDTLKQEIFISRDRFGVKPLYYWIGPHGDFYFASEIKQFTILPEWEAVINHQMAYDYLAWGLCDHTEETLFKGVFQLEGGCFIKINVAEMGAGIKISWTKERWYTLDTEEVFKGSFEEAKSHFRNIFNDAVRLRLRADVEVGTGLSGGLDSSSIVCTISRQLREQNSQELQNTFSACVADKRYDERNYMEIVEKHASVKAHYIYPQLLDLFERLDKLVWHQDEPFAGTSIFAESCVFELVASTPVRVTLDGHGADEILGGYHVFFAHRLAGFLRRGNFIAYLRDLKTLKDRYGYDRKTMTLAAVKRIIPKWIGKLMGSSSPDNDRSERWLDFEQLQVQRRNPFVAKGESKIGIRELSKAQLLYTSLPVQLHWVDRDSMTYSIESRAPFLDYRLVEFIISCPDDFKVKNGITKLALRESLKEVLPADIYNRIDKMGFVTPEPAWVKEHGSDFFRKEIEDAIINSKGILKDNVTLIAEQIISGTVPYDPVVWRWICFGRWMKIFSVKIGI